MFEWIEMSELVVDRVSAFAEKLLPTMELELVEVQFRREQQGWILRIYIDAVEGITHEHCRMVSRELGDYLEVEELIDHAYQLEVSSPGLERKLKKVEDFERFSGRKAKVKLHQAIDEQKVFVGEIVRVDGEMIELVIEDGENIVFSFDNINAARLTI
jgi:ribosome maturation factor RimP